MGDGGWGARNACRANAKYGVRDRRQKAYSRRNSCSKFNRSRQIASTSLTRRHVRLFGGPGQFVPVRLQFTAGCVVPSELSLPNLAVMGAVQVTVPVRGHTAVLCRSPLPLPPKQIRPALTVRGISDRPPPPHVALRIAAEPPAALQHAEVLLCPAVGRQRRRGRRRRLGDRRRRWRRWRLGRLDRPAQRHLVPEVGLKCCELGLELLFVVRPLVERGLQRQCRIDRWRRRRRSRRFESGQVQRRIDRRTGAQEPRGDQQRQQQQHADQQRRQPARPASPGRPGHVSRTLGHSSKPRFWGLSPGARDDAQSAAADFFGPSAAG